MPDNERVPMKAENTRAMTGRKRGRDERSDNDLLIPMERNNTTGETRYVTRSQYEIENKRPPTPEDLDSKAVLIKSPSGTYLNKRATYQTTYGGGSEDPKERETFKDKAFKDRMNDLGLSDKNFAELNEDKLTGDARYIATPGGKRRQFLNYKHPEQAGVNSPDVLVKSKDGVYTGFYPKLEPSVASIHDLKNKFDEVYLKTKGQNYIEPDTYNKRYGINQAEKALAYFKGEPYHNERKDLPKALYRAAHGEYVSKEAFEKSKGPVDYEKADILFQSPGGRSLLNPKVYQRIDPKGFDEFVKSEKITGDMVTNKVDMTRPEVLVAVGGRLISADLARKAMKETGIKTDKPLAEVFGRENVLVQNIGKNDKLTGNYRDLPSAEARGSNRDTGRLEALGVHKNEGQEKLATVIKSGELLSRTLDQRSRSENVFQAA